MAATPFDYVRGSPYSYAARPSDLRGAAKQMHAGLPSRPRALGQPLKFLLGLLVSYMPLATRD